MHLGLDICPLENNRNNITHDKRWNHHDKDDPTPLINTRTVKSVAKKMNGKVGVPHVLWNEKSSAKPSAVNFNLISNGI